jgi:hypothetical protein
MPLVKVIRHGFEFWEMTAAPKSAQLEQLPERRRDVEMSPDGRRNIERAAIGRGFGANEAREAEELVIRREDFLELSKRIEERDASVAMDREELDAEPSVSVDEAIERLKRLMAGREVGI